MGSQKVRRVQAYPGKDYRRWRLWKCAYMDPAAAQKEIALLKLKGYEAKVWAPLPQHKTTGHIHIVVLCTFDELCRLAGIERRKPIASAQFRQETAFLVQS